MIKRINRDPNIEYTSEYISLPDVNNYIHNTQVLLDINRKGQKGLTVLESWARKETNYHKC